MKQLLNEQAPDPRVQEDWNRQCYTATVIRERHKRGIACVLLADEVGMGKTYTALAAIATQLVVDAAFHFVAAFQSGAMG